MRNLEDFVPKKDKSKLKEIKLYLKAEQIYKHKDKFGLLVGVLEYKNNTKKFYLKNRNTTQNGMLYKGIIYALNNLLKEDCFVSIYTNTNIGYGRLLKAVESGKGISSSVANSEATMDLADILRAKGHVCKFNYGNEFYKEFCKRFNLGQDISNLKKNLENNTLNTDAKKDKTQSTY